MKQEMYSNLIGKEVWDKYQYANIWSDDYFAIIEMSDADCNRVDDGKFHCDCVEIVYDSILGNGEIKYVAVVQYVDVIGALGMDKKFLSELPINQQKKVYEKLMKELANIK